SGMPAAEVQPLCDHHIVFLGGQPARVSPELSSMKLTQGRHQAPARPRRPHPTELEAGFARFLAGLCGEGRLNIGRYRPAVLQRRQAACLRALRTATVDEAVAKLACVPG